MPDQPDIDARIQTYYSEVFDEHVRLTTRSAQGPLEFQRTQEIIREHVPIGRVLDVGGGAGIHSRALIDAGYDVEMIDPVPRHVEQARGAGVNAFAGDARDLRFADASFDAVIMLGPLYHLSSRDDRLTALRDAAWRRRARRRAITICRVRCSVVGTTRAVADSGGVGGSDRRRRAGLGSAVPRRTLPHV